MVVRGRRPALVVVRPRPSAFAGCRLPKRASARGEAVTRGTLTSCTTPARVGHILYTPLVLGAATAAPPRVSNVHSTMPTLPAKRALLGKSVS